MKVIFTVCGVAEGLPGAVGKEIAPIVGEPAVFALLDYIIILVLFLACEGSTEPFVLVGGVVDDKVHDYGYATFLSGGERMKKSHYGNAADDCVENYSYDYYFMNDKSLAEAERDFLALLAEVLDCK